MKLLQHKMKLEGPGMSRVYLEQTAIIQAVKLLGHLEPTAMATMGSAFENENNETGLDSDHPETLPWH